MQTDWKLAVELDRFMEAYDPYEYMDCVDDPEQNVLEIVALIQSGKTQDIMNWLLEVAEDLNEKE